MWTPEYFTYLVDMPHSVLGATIPNNDGTFSIYINSYLSDAGRCKVLEHEMKHVYMDHFYQQMKSVRVIENEADGKIAPKPVPAAARTETVPVASAGADLGDDWLYDPYGLPLHKLDTPPEPGTKVVPLYSSLNAIVGPWKDLGLLDYLISRSGPEWAEPEKK